MIPPSPKTENLPGDAEPPTNLPFARHRFGISFDFTSCLSTWEDDCAYLLHLLGGMWVRGGRDDVVCFKIHCEGLRRGVVD